VCTQTHTQLCRQYTHHCDYIPDNTATVDKKKHHQKPPLPGTSTTWAGTSGKRKKTVQNENVTFYVSKDTSLQQHLVTISKVYLIVTPASSTTDL